MESQIRIVDVFKITGVGSLPIGKVQSGTLCIGMKAEVNHVEIIIKSIEIKHKVVNKANIGDNVGLEIRGTFSSHEQLKSLLIGKIITFLDSSYINNQYVEHQISEPVKPVKKGFFSFLKRK